MAGCNVDKIPIIFDLFETPLAERGNSWNTRFFAAIIDAPMINPEPKVFYGPDFFPYLHLKTPEPGEPFDGYCISESLDYITSHGVGVAINPTNGGQQVEWVFSYGDIVTYKMFGTFEPNIPTPPTPEEISPTTKEKITITQPPPELLPDYVRDVIHRYFIEGLEQENPGVFLMQRSSQPVQELVFSLHREDFETDGKFQQAMQTLAWFLPQHYRVTAISSNNALVEQFALLYEPT